MNLTIVASTSFVGGMNYFGEEGARDLAQRMIPFIQEAINTGQITFSRS